MEEGMARDGNALMKGAKREKSLELIVVAPSVTSSSY